ncbi:MAG: family 20 glycosylhydrolase, partial [Nocardioides sp.]|nr:family 20 glycosylhydrolase [Nocardioides sp.]
MRNRLLSAAAALLATLLMIPLGLGMHADAAQAADGAAAPVTLPALTGWQPASGGFRLTRTSRVLVPDAALRTDAGTFVSDLAQLIGRRLEVVVTSAAPRTGDIVLRLDPRRSDLKSEGYALSVGRSITVTGRTTTGTFWGTRTLLQILRPGTAVPAGHVTDVPAYAERGIGVCACYIHVSMPWLERTIKDASYLKLNQLQLELKVKSTAQPEANQWGYYTPAEITELQKVADAYHVTLVPEVNSPGHIDPWIANRPDLQLTDSNGVKQPTRLDITKPEAFDFLTSIIDEYFKVFRTPYWHMGADEYMIGSDYSKYPQIEAYAKQKFGANAVPQDAYNDFINRVDDYVKAKGKTLRMWNDGISSAATVPLHPDIVVEHWVNSSVKPSKIIADGHRVENAA